MRVSSRKSTIGIFDSGIGGLSVLRHIHAQRPGEHLTYLADAGFAPYGDKPESLIVARALAIADFLIDSGAKALVVACNTATAAAIDAIRARYSSINVIGVEPGLKPAALASRSARIGVLATPSTLASNRFARLLRQVTSETGVAFYLQSCPGLADLIESERLDSSLLARSVATFVNPLLDEGVDTLVLGCTHYAFVQPLIEDIVANRLNKQGQTTLRIIDTGDAVARRLGTLIDQRIDLSLDTEASPGEHTFLTTGNSDSLNERVQQLLGLKAKAISIDLLCLE